MGDLGDGPSNKLSAQPSLRWPRPANTVTRAADSRPSFAPVKGAGRRGAVKLIAPRYATPRHLPNYGSSHLARLTSTASKIKAISQMEHRISLILGCDLRPPLTRYGFLTGRSRKRAPPQPCHPTSRAEARRPGHQQAAGVRRPVRAHSARGAALGCPDWTSSWGWITFPRRMHAGWPGAGRKKTWSSHRKVQDVWLPPKHRISVHSAAEGDRGKLE